MKLIVTPSPIDSYIHASATFASNRLVWQVLTTNSVNAAIAAADHQHRRCNKKDLEVDEQQEEFMEQDED